jgi:hypothetical protein
MNNMNSNSVKPIGERLVESFVNLSGESREVSLNEASVQVYREAPETLVADLYGHLPLAAEGGSRSFRVKCLALASEIALMAGDLDDAERLLMKVNGLEPTPEMALELVAIRELQQRERSNEVPIEN